MPFPDPDTVPRVDQTPSAPNASGPAADRGPGRARGRGAGERAAHGLDLSLGQRVRALRRARGLSLKTVAGRMGVSIGFVSQVERGLSSASVRVLAGLAEALDVTIGSLFEAEGDEPAGSIVVRAAERRRLTFRGTGIAKQLLTPPATDSPLDLYLIEIEPGGHTGEQAYAHGGEEAGLVLQGTVELDLEGRTHTLDRGDAFRFTSTRPHGFRNPGPAPARVVWVNARAPAPRPRDP